ncbi:hypothetical protein Ancab_028014 [Ancistrocladus abbreviatus]
MKMRAAKKTSVAKKGRASKKGSSCLSTKLHFKRRRKWLVCINAEESEKAADLLVPLCVKICEVVPQNEERLTQEANVPQSEVESGDEDWSTDNVLEEELGSDFDELFELRRQNFIRKQDKKGDIPGMMRPATTNAPQSKKSRGRPRKSSNNPSSANPPPSMEHLPSSTQEHPSLA